MKRHPEPSDLTNRAAIRRALAAARDIETRRRTGRPVPFRLAIAGFLATAVAILLALVAVLIITACAFAAPLPPGPTPGGKGPRVHRTVRVKGATGRQLPTVYVVPLPALCREGATPRAARDDDSGDMGRVVWPPESCAPSESRGPLPVSRPPLDTPH